ncbi:UPF0041-domain-containing protein [Schizophyllum commune H4-8]|uniref:Mitochondrial pyruvate carrier n=1 Tax=Schizophyllum commune (strain H4-8 / FGSC 9210) TaxID=578458 RepID=D8QCV1_SCHCM|nr:UPF0041-domain-containing protein [Schizophyllum commune H4-8]KAI5889737.1 UPF0041-domain-containing protein [Schizophyllum commune H4-8]
MAAAGSKFQAFMNHPAGPKTVFFWAPLMKWCLVAAGLKDLSRPADKLSVSQNVALAATGFIWVRYSLVITPVNYSLAAVNFFVGLSGLTQLVRVAKYVIRSVHWNHADGSQLPAFASERHEGMNAAVHRVLPCLVIPYPAQFPVVDLPIAQCHAVRIHMRSVQCLTIVSGTSNHREPAPRRRSSLRLLRSCLSSSVSSPEKEPMALDASPNMPPFSCK